MNLLACLAILSAVVVVWCTVPALWVLCLPDVPMAHRRSAASYWGKNGDAFVGPRLLRYCSGTGLQLTMNRSVLVTGWAGWGFVRSKAAGSTRVVLCSSHAPSDRCW